MYPTCSLQSMEFRELVGGNKLSYGEYPGEAVDFVLADSPNNVRHATEDLNSDYDRFTSRDVKETVRFCQQI